ncbi:ALK and LTK ligand 2b-like [Brienomyrus brachyistius]|uniref:ALK and LTK ligand 2b-like n=1 Tax=Brienomyrus brachyistius TaxID=42636 RepID=UPI0020B28444|nr:ALK and LTK ligand 2b-like [Brienomyrus brachyistius]
MTGLRQHSAVGLVILLCTAGSCKYRAVTKNHRDEKSVLEQMMDIMKRIKGQQQEGSAEITMSIALKKQNHSSDPMELQEYKSHKEGHILEIFPRDLRKKDKFIKHLTGPLYISPKCRKHVYRLYHNTRDCTVPAYYKRCARLLTRLAGSARCT